MHFNCGVGFALATQGKGSKGPFLKAAPLLCRARRATVRSAFAMWLLVNVGNAGHRFGVPFCVKAASLVCWPRRATVRSAFLMWLWVYVGTQGISSKCPPVRRPQLYVGHAGPQFEVPFNCSLRFMVAAQGKCPKCSLQGGRNFCWPRRATVRSARKM